MKKRCYEYSYLVCFVLSNIIALKKKNFHNYKHACLHILLLHFNKVV